VQVNVWSEAPASRDFSKVLLIYAQSPVKGALRITHYERCERQRSIPFPVTLTDTAFARCQRNLEVAFPQLVYLTDICHLWISATS
jgi:hypothetical protein